MAETVARYSSTRLESSLLTFWQQALNRAFS
jgi:hypothetical protein